MSLRCRDLVIGSGPGGAVTAALLAEAGHDVILAEEGNGATPPPEPFSLDEMSQRYRYRGLNPTFGKPKVAYVEGRCLGGGSEINSALYHRTPPEVLESWRKNYGLEGAAADEMQPYCEAVERSIGVRLSPGPLPLAARKLQQGAAALGWRWIETPRWVRYGAERQPDGSPVAERLTLARTWIPRIRAAGGRILSATRVTGLLRTGQHWVATSRTAATDGAVTADRVFLCAGAVQSPLLLRRTGIRRHVGDTLAMHPTLKVVALFSEEVNYPGLGVPFVQVKEFAPGATFGSSIASPPHLAMAMLDHPEAGAGVLRRWGSAAIYYVAATGPATGKIREFPFTGDPVVLYQPGPRVLHELAAGLRNLCRLLLEAGAVELFPCLHGCGPLRGPDDLRRLPECLDAGRTSLMTIHLFGSCPMGQRRDRTAVDSWGRVWDAPGLSVHDASILCDAPGVNPQGSVMALAARNTEANL